MQRLNQALKEAREEARLEGDNCVRLREESLRVKREG